MSDIRLITISNEQLVPSIEGFSSLTGKEALAQRIVKLLLTAKGSDFFNPKQGTALLSLYGVYTEKSLDSVKMLLPEIIRNFVSDIKQEQMTAIINGINYNDEDLLEDILINDISFDTTYSGWSINLEIINRAHNSVKIVVP